MKTRFLIIVGMILFMGFLQVPESFSADLTPSCNIGVFVSSDTQCHIQDSPPCTKPSFEKNGLCVVTKNDLCKGESVLVNGECVIDIGNFRVYDPTFAKQNLLTSEPVSDPTRTSFRESGGSIGLLYSLSGFSIVGIVVGFFVIKQWKNRK